MLPALPLSLHVCLYEYESAVAFKAQDEQIPRTGFSNAHNQYRARLPSPEIANLGRRIPACGRGFSPVRSSVRVPILSAERAAGKGVDTEAGMVRLLRSMNAIPDDVMYPSVPVDAPRNSESYTLATVPGTCTR